MIIILLPLQNPWQYITLVPLTLGGILSAYGDTNFSYIGVLLSFSGALFRALRIY